jgi:hypothetical protein
MGFQFISSPEYAMYFDGILPGNSPQMTVACQQERIFHVLGKYEGETVVQL